jgi:NADH:ubiquinone oxidoreductase subunit 6 (subunit J)
MSRYYRSCTNPDCPFIKEQGHKQPYRTQSKTAAFCPHCSTELPPYNPPSPAPVATDDTDETEPDDTATDDGNNGNDGSSSGNDDVSASTESEESNDVAEEENDDDEERRTVMNKQSILWPILTVIAAFFLLGAAARFAPEWFGLALGIVFIAGAIALLISSLVWLISRNPKADKEGFKTFGQWSAVTGGILIGLALFLALFFLGTPAPAPTEVDETTEAVEEVVEEEIVEEEVVEEEIVEEEVVEEDTLGWERLETKELPSGSICIGDVEIEIEGKFVRYYDEGGVYESTIVINNSLDPINIHAEWGAGEIPVTSVDINELIQNELEHGCDGKCTIVRLITFSPTGLMTEEFIHEDE